MKILIAIDQDPASADALSFAKTIVPPDADVTVVNVADYGVAPMGTIGAFSAGYTYSDALLRTGTSQEVVDSIDARAQATVRGAAQELESECGSHVHAEVIHGDAATAICAAAEERDIDLIVLGTHDKGAWSRFWFGSVSDHVVHHAPCSVVVVR